MTDSTRFVHPYLPQTEDQIKDMLAKIGVSSIDELFNSIPKKLRFSGELKLPKPHTEHQTLSRIKDILQSNKSVDDYDSFLGGGIYHHSIPSALPALINRSEFITSYTPYAPEMSQGMLQGLWEYQSMIAELTQLELVNSSMYDMATALGEAALMCTRVTKKEIFLVPSYLQPERYQTLLTYTKGPQIKVKCYPFDPITGRVNIEELIKIFDTYKDNISGIYIENPNFFGVIEEEVSEVSKIAHNCNGLSVVGIDPISLGILQSPGYYGADIAIGEGQGLGLPMNFGGPLLGLFATKNDKRLARAIPGRIIGLTTEKNSSNRAFTMTLQTREQHIRREKATSNICTNNALCALASNIFLSLIGPNGLKNIAESSMARAAYLAEKLNDIDGIKAPVFTSQFFKEFVFQITKRHHSDKFDEYLIKNGILGGISLTPNFPSLANSYLVSVTELTSYTAINKFVKILKDYLNGKGGN